MGLYTKTTVWGWMVVFILLCAFLENTAQKAVFKLIFFGLMLYLMCYKVAVQEIIRDEMFPNVQWRGVDIRGDVIRVLFNSYSFLFFFPVVVLIYFLIPKRTQYIWLLAASYFFYMCWDARYVLLLLFSTIVTYISGLLIAGTGHAGRSGTFSKFVVFCSFALNLGILFLFKYLDFAVGILNAALGGLRISIVVPEFNLLLPVGISFYIFQALSYTVDVYRRDVPAERNFLKYALFVSFFPQLVAGPIERSKNLLKQVNETHTFQYDNMRNGLLLMLWGYFLKLMIADRAAVFVDAVFSQPAEYQGMFVVIAMVLFAFQIYCDFAGYSLIAKGAAEVMGFRLMDNFHAPYFAESVAEFWRRWHISLSSWLRDYLYIPLGGSRKGTLCKYRNLMIVFLASGLWHGAAGTYVVWGLMHGVYQIAGDLKNRCCGAARLQTQPGKRILVLQKCFRILATFILVDFAWIFFRAASVKDAVRMIYGVFEVHNFSILWDMSVYQLGLGKPDFLVLFLSVALLLFADVMNYRGIELRKVIVRQRLWCRWIIYYAAIFSILVFGMWGAKYDAAAFIYFQF